MADIEKTEEEYIQLVDELKDYVVTHLNEKLQEMLKGADEELFDLSNNANNNEDQTRYFEMMKMLRNLQKKVAKDYQKGLDKLLIPYVEAEPKDKPKLDTMNSELSLVGQREMEDMVMIKSIGNQTASGHRERISHLAMRLEELGLETTAIFEKKALEPINLCQIFNDALGYMFDISDKKELFKFYDSYVLSTLGKFYDHLNQTLSDAGILQHIQIGGAKKQNTPDRPKSTPQEAPDEPDVSEDTGNQNATASSPRSTGGAGQQSSGPRSSAGANQAGAGSQNSGYNLSGQQSGADGDFPTLHGEPTVSSDNAEPGEVFIHDGPQSFGGYAMTAAIGTSFQKDPSQGGQAGSGFASGGSAAGGSMSGAEATGNTGSGGYQSNYTHTTAGMPASHVDNVLTNYLGSPISGKAKRSDDQEAVYSQTVGNAQYLGHTEIIDALSSVQQNPDFTDPQELKFDANAVKQAVISTIAKKSGGAVTKRINQIAEKTIDFIEMIFDAIIEDDSISDTIKALLLRLQIPVIKASMIDPEFFIYDDHPARVLLDKTTEVGIGVVDRDSDVYKRLDHIITKVVTDYDLKTSTFEKALKELVEYTEEREKIAKEKEAEAQKKVLKEHARNTVLRTLRSVTKGKRLPESVHALVLRRWPTLMFNHYVDNGKENEEWTKIVEVLRDIIESIQPLENAEDLARMKEERGQLTEQARAYLSRTTHSKSDLDTVIKDLEGTYDAMEARAKFEEEEIEKAVETVKQTGPVEKPELPPVEEPPKQALPSNVMPGMWFKVYMGEESRPRRCKLSVILVEDSKLVFVNYTGEVIAEKGFDEFRDELEHYQSKVIMGHSVFDHALSNAVTSIQ